MPGLTPETFNSGPVVTPAAANFTTQPTDQAFNATTSPLCPADTAWPVRVKAGDKCALRVHSDLAKHGIEYTSACSTEQAEAPAVDLHAQDTAITIDTSGFVLDFNVDDTTSSSLNSSSCLPPTNAPAARPILAREMLPALAKVPSGQSATRTERSPSRCSARICPPAGHWGFSSTAA